MGERKRIGLREVRALQPGERIWDTGVPGFGARRQNGTTVSYGIFFRTHESRQRWQTIGRHGAPWTPDQAREEARRILGDVAGGADAAAAKQAKRRPVTVAELCERYLADAQAGRLLVRGGRPKKPLTLASGRGRIKGHIIPLLGRLAVAAVTKQDVERFMHAVAKMPRRVDLRDRFDEIVAHAKALARLVLDEAVVNAAPGLYQAFGTEDGSDVPDAMDRLIRLVNREKRRLPRGRGSATSATFLGYINGQLLCARIIVEAWRRLHDRGPSPRNDHAQQACAALWIAAGQSPTEQVLQGRVAEGASWVRHLRDARQLDKTGADEAVKRNAGSAQAINRMIVERASAIFRGMGTSLPETSWMLYHDRSTPWDYTQAIENTDKRQ